MLSPDIASQTSLCEQIHAQRELTRFIDIARLQKRKRSNTDFIFPFNDKLLHLSSANVLYAENIAELLSQYLNQRFVDALIAIVIYNV